jgi:hypothetical protein
MLFRNETEREGEFEGLPPANTRKVIMLHINCSCCQAVSLHYSESKYLLGERMLLNGQLNFVFSFLNVHHDLYMRAEETKKTGDHHYDRQFRC